MGLMVLGVLLVLVILILAANIRIVPQAHAYILERLGGYKETWGVGIHFKIPILDRVAKRVSLLSLIHIFYCTCHCVTSINLKINNKVYRIVYLIQNNTSSF